MSVIIIIIIIIIITIIISGAIQILVVIVIVTILQARNLCKSLVVLGEYPLVVLPLYLGHLYT